MRVAKAVAAVALLLIFPCVGAVAQEDLDLEALLEDLTEPGMEEEAVAAVEEDLDMDMEAEDDDILPIDEAMEEDEGTFVEVAPDAEELETEVEALLEEEALEAEDMGDDMPDMLVEDEMADEPAAMEMEGEEEMAEVEEAADPVMAAAQARAAQEEIRLQAMEVEGHHRRMLHR